MRMILCVLAVFAFGCPPTPDPTTVTIANHTKTDTTVYVAFGAASKITASSPGWPEFCEGSGLVCNFSLAGGTVRPLPSSKENLNATFSFGSSGCGATKAEVNVNNPDWYDILDVSLVDGYSNRVQITATPPGDAGGADATLLGPPLGASGNENVYGLFPLGCDICVERQSPPCGIAPGKDGCKAGTQYDPKPPCQWQGPKKGGGSLAVEIALTGDGAAEEK